MEDQLPAVASNFYTFCKKCDEDRYHVVLAHKTALSASIQCEVCKGKKTYKITEEAKKTRRTARTASKSGSTRGKNSHAQQYADHKEKIGVDNAAGYKMTQKYDSDMAIDHPKFGIGFITAAAANKISVLFEDTERQLIHNRS